MTCSAKRREIPYRKVPHHVSLAIRKSSLSYMILYIVERKPKKYRIVINYAGARYLLFPCRNSSAPGRQELLHVVVASLLLIEFPLDDLAN